MNVMERATHGSGGFFWENAGRVAEVRREGAAEVCEASGPGLRVITVTDKARGLKVSAAVDAAGVYWRFFRVEGNGGRLIATSRTPDHEHLFRRVLSALSTMGGV